MEITQISPYRFNSALKLRQTKPKVQNYVANPTLNTCYKPFFTGKLADEEKLKNIPGIHCACCGDDFIPKKEYQKLGSDEVTKNSAVNIQKLSKYEHKMNPIEKKIFNILKNYSAKFPQKNFQQLLQEANVEHLPKLETYQKNILNSIEKKSSQMSLESQQVIDQALKKIKKILFEEPKEIPQKRYRSVQIFDNLSKSFLKNDNELALFDSIFIEIISLPSSGQNVDAFIAKYAHRSPKEISQRLVANAIPTIEHVVASSNGGEDKIENKIILCECCNKERSNFSYKFLVKNHPEMKLNLQKYIDRIIEEINAKRLIGFDNYPEAIKKIFSDKKIGLDLDISKLQTKKIKLKLQELNKQLQEKNELIKILSNSVNKNRFQLSDLPLEVFLNFQNENFEAFQFEYPIFSQFINEFDQNSTSINAMLRIFETESKRIKKRKPQLIPKMLKAKKELESKNTLQNYLECERLYQLEIRKYSNLIETENHLERVKLVKETISKLITRLELNKN